MEQIKDIFSFKPFVLSDNPFTVYKPYTDIKVDAQDNRFCVCAHLCDLFLTYPVSDWGVRSIPRNACCKFGGKCHGSRILKNGLPTRKNVDLPYECMKIVRCQGK